MGSLPSPRCQQTEPSPRVAGTAYQLGSPEVIVIRADVSRVADCKRFVDETVEHFGRCKRNENSSIFALGLSFSFF
jgi:NAD(P)-dependent dehydrogenase (short-subunit alcohol dehydrogenase family)